MSGLNLMCGLLYMHWQYYMRGGPPLKRQLVPIPQQSKTSFDTDERKTTFRSFTPSLKGGKSGRRLGDAHHRRLQSCSLFGQQ